MSNQNCEVGGCKALELQRDLSPKELQYTYIPVELNIDEAIDFVSEAMGRRNFDKDDTIDSHLGQRVDIAKNVGVDYDEAELIWNCALNRFKGNCKLIKGEE